MANPIPTIKVYLLRFHGREIEAQMADGFIFSKEELTASSRHNKDNDDEFYGMNYDEFFKEVDEVTVKYLREDAQYTPEQWEEVQRENERYERELLNG